MKRLKYACPFGGKRFPFYLAAISALFPLFGMMLTDTAPLFRFILMFACPIAVLTACFFWEQALTDDEKEICASCELPLWLPANSELAEAVRDRTSFPNVKTVIVGVITAIFAVSFLVPSAGGVTNYSLVGLCIIPGMLFVLFQLFESIIWGTVDESTVYTIIPIDHMYDVKHTDKNGTVWYESYLVFYQPDGRYTLHARDGDGNANSVVIVKHRGLVTWLPYREERNLIE